jgi:bifunctional non-homologous end joining protein LigD
LEHEGVFKSWAIPKGMPTDAGVRHLAIETEDHELAFGDFEGAIPRGDYGAGSIDIWDRGIYIEERWTNSIITVVLLGALVQGRYTLRRFRREAENAWLLWKSRS